MKARYGPPKSARILTQWVDQYARAEGQAPGRVRSWVSFMVLAGALERAGFTQTGGPKFTVKGGYLPPLKAACEAVFSLRGTHPWPPFVQAHEHWIEPFGYLAESVGLSARDIHQAVAEAREFLQEIDTVSPSR